MSLKRSGSTPISSKEQDKDIYFLRSIHSISFPQGEQVVLPMPFHILTIFMFYIYFRVHKRKLQLTIIICNNKWCNGSGICIAYTAYKTTLTRITQRALAFKPHNNNISYLSWANTHASHSQFYAMLSPRDGYTHSRCRSLSRAPNAFTSGTNACYP